MSIMPLHLRSSLADYFRVVALTLLSMAAQSEAATPTTLYSFGQPTDEDQLYLELINRARANPTAEGLRLATSTDLSRSVV